MRFLLLALIASASAAQVGVDVSAAGGGMMVSSGELIIGETVEAGIAAVSVDPDFPRGIRLSLALTRSPGDDRGEGETLAVGIGGELPLSGGRNGVYLALGAALIDFDNRVADACRRNPDCFFEGGTVESHAGLAATIGLGARIPITGRLWAEPSLSAFVWGEVLPSARIGVGWRIQ